MHSDQRGPPCSFTLLPPKPSSASFPLHASLIVSSLHWSTLVPESRLDCARSCAMRASPAPLRVLACRSSSRTRRPGPACASWIHRQSHAQRKAPWRKRSCKWTWHSRSAVNRVLPGPGRTHARTEPYRRVDLRGMVWV